MLDRHVTYREIETSVNISSTSIDSIIHSECSSWITHNLTNAQKQVRVDWCKEMLEKHDGGASKDVYKIVTGDESWICA